MLILIFFFTFASEVIEINVCDSWGTSQVGPGAQQRGRIDTADQLAIHVNSLRLALRMAAAGRNENQLSR